ncbi:MAG: type IX secretion system outer membrane channel protein PorV [Candidatus Kryptonium sp.]|nr:type IX secretion system outer membrane channel protein PorV [Candidatus Kryptonium sp.]MCX7761505.1 type IX secretion system outer membrane channel protein PorV [Candidatus Kryptonium sp.]MDW8109507.1 type IX secretion system outer membrane channel protein PorV [Candidatus Kryptonium sp.]
MLFKKGAILGLSILLVFASFHSLVYAQGGDAAVPFLLIAPDSRAGAMGETGVALADNANAIFWNPAGLAFQRGTEITFTHAKWLPQFSSDLSYEYLSAKHYLSVIDATIGANITFFNLGSFERRDENNTYLGTFKAFEYAVTLAYAMKLTQSLGFGLNLRYIHSQLAPFGTAEEQGRGVANGVSFDIGFLFREYIFGRRVSAGFNLSNLGPMIHYIDREQADPLPTHLRVGFAFDIIQTKYNNLTATVDFGRVLVRRYPGENRKPDPLPKSLITAWGEHASLRKVTIGTGVEYWYGSPRLIALRAGYFYESPRAGGRRFATFGAGVRYSIVGVDFSYISTFEENHPLANTLRFTISLNFGSKE